jgi:hypothetical protein
VEARRAEPNGTDIVLAASAGPPNTKIALDLGIDNLVAVGVVHAESRLTERLERQVGEAQRLAAEIMVKLHELEEIYKAELPDPDFVKRCQALVELAADLGFRLTFTPTKGVMNPDTLKYEVGFQFQGDLRLVKTYNLADAHAEDLRDEIAELREQQATQAREARITKDRLNPHRLEKLMRAGIAENAMRGTEEGKQTLDAWLTYIDKAVDGTTLRQIGMD